MSASDLVHGPPGAATLRERFEDELFAFLDARRRDAQLLDERAVILVDEIRRLMEAGGKRLRPAFCYWGYRATGAPDDARIVRAGAALELLHTFALIHDDLIDGSDERRGVPSSSRNLEQAGLARGLPDPARFGTSAALLAGDLAVVLADQLLLDSGFGPEILGRALAGYHEMRVEMAAGQVLGLLVHDPVDEREARRIAALKGGLYSVERPLLLGAALAGGSAGQRAVLSAFGRPLGEAFQLRDDLVDDPATSPVGKETVNALVGDARAALDPRVLDPEAIRALASLADLMVLA
jgi:geranylgeranyl diphosphate synthase type I